MDESSRFGRYKILERLGKGGMGVIYKAHDAQLDRVVALKTILPDFVSSPEVKERLIREAQAAARLQHPNVVTVFDIGETEDKRLYFAMEYVRGRSLREVIPMRIPLERRLEIMAAVCKALSFAHQHGIIHRDVKPTNVLLAEDGTVKLFDFGIAHLAGSSLTRTGVAIGTPEYMSPEMVEGGELDARSDIFSCGVMLYEMLTRDNPFRSDRITSTMYRIVHSQPSNLRELRPNLPQDLEEILVKMLAKNPDHRYASMDEVVDDLEHIVSRGLLNKAIRAKELGDLMEQVDAKVSAAEKDPRARQVLDKKLAAPLGRRRRQVRKITKADDTSITLAHIDRELISLREFDERLDEILDKELPEGIKAARDDDIPTADSSSQEAMPPEIQDTAATMRWEGDTTARQGMAAALSGESEEHDHDERPEQSADAGSPPQQGAGEESAQVAAGSQSAPETSAEAGPGGGATGAASHPTPPPPPESPSSSGVAGQEGQDRRTQSQAHETATPPEADDEADAGPPGPKRPARSRDSETEPTVVVPTSSGSPVHKRWLLPAALLAAVLLVALIWIGFSWLSGPEPIAQSGEPDPAQEASLQEGDGFQEGESAGDAASDTSAEDGSPQSASAGGAARSGQESSRESAQRSPRAPTGTSSGQATGSQAAQPEPSAETGDRQASAPAGNQGQGAAGSPNQPPPEISSFTFQVQQVNARKSLIPGNRECAGTLEVSAEMIRFRSEECTSRTLVRAILTGAELEEGILTVRQVNDTSYAFAIAQGDLPAMRRALSQFEW